MEDIFEDRLSTLESNADNFTNWLYSQFKPFIEGNILEISSGVGTYSKKILKDFPSNKITLTEISNTLLDILRKIDNDKVSVFKLDLNELEDYKKIGYEKFDTIICANVLEHVKKDEFSLNQFNKMLRKNGKLLLLVPNNPNLYGEADKILGHYRRYTKDDIIQKAKKANFTIKKSRFFNSIGIIGWKITKASKKPKHNPKLLKLFNQLIPLVKGFDDKIISKISGLSIFVVLEKSN